LQEHAYVLQDLKNNAKKDSAESFVKIELINKKKNDTYGKSQ